MGLERPTGVLVASVYDKGPAAEAGLKRGDVILAVDGQAVDDPDAFGYRFALKGIEGETSLTVLRGGKRIVMPVKLHDAARDPAARACAVPQPLAVRGRDRRQHVARRRRRVAARHLGGRRGRGGDRGRQRRRQRVGFQKGDLILAINGERVTSSKDVERMIARSSRGTVADHRSTAAGRC